MRLRRSSRRGGPPAWTEPPPDPPELPETLDPRWPAWFAPVALVASFFVMSIALVPVFVPIGIVDENALADGSLEGPLLLLLIAVQDAALVGTGVLFARLTVPFRRWHWGMRPTRLWPTIGVAALAAVLLLGFELGYFAVLELDDSNVDNLGAGESLIAAVAVCLAVIVVAPVTEEVFFRAFFYRALRNRMRVFWAALIDALVFASLHFEGPNTAAGLPVIAVFGFGMCLVYERTGSLFAVIAIHAVFNTFAVSVEGGQPMVVAFVVGGIVLLACLLVPRLLRRGPSPMRGAARRHELAAAPPLPAARAPAAVSAATRA